MSEEMIADPNVPGEVSDLNPWEPTEPVTTTEPTTTAEPVTKVEPTTQTTEPVKVPTAPTATEIAKAVAEGIKDGNKAPAKPLTDAEQAAIYEKTFGVVKPTVAQIEQLYKGGEDAVNALHTILQQSVKQAVLMATYLANESIDKIDSKYAPALTITEERQNQRMESDFAKEHPDLMAYKPLLLDIKAEAIKAKIPFKSEAEAKQYVADRARSLLKTMNIAPTTSTNGTGGTVTTTQPAAKTKMVSTSTGGQSGSKGKGAVSNDSNDPETLARSLFS